MTITATDTTVPDALPTDLVPGRGGGGPASTRTVVAYGFWIFLLSDIIMFSGLFAAFALGAAFLFIEIREFADMVGQGAGPSRSAFLSAFFTLVGMHGAHVTSGLLWLIYMVAQTAAKGLRPHVLRRLLCFSLFWHALD